MSIAKKGPDQPPAPHPDAAGREFRRSGLWSRYRTRKTVHPPLPWLGYAFVTLNVLAIAFFVLDAPLAEGAARLPPQLILFAKTVTDVGRLQWLLLMTVLATAIALLVAARSPDRRRRFRLFHVGLAAGYATITLLLAGLAVHALKLAIGRARPPLYDQY